MSTNSLPSIVPIPSKHVLDLTNKRFGRWYVLGYVGMTDRGSTKWLCRCDCGVHKVVNSSGLRSNRSKSCGCYKVENHAQSVSPRTIHGKSDTVEYRIWYKMLERCTRKTDRAYSNYGGRGIKVCSRWTKFENFLVDMGKRPSPKHSLDRIDNDKDYCPENCRWATHTQQANNKRNNVKITWRGVTKTLPDWARSLNMPCETLRRRFDLGWSVEKAFTTQVRKV